MLEKPDLLWAFLAADLLVVVACFSVAPALWLFARRRVDLRPGYQWLLILLGGFLAVGGALHLLEIWSVRVAGAWMPQAWGSLLTSVLAIIAAVGVWLLLPKLLGLQQYQAAYDELLERHRQLADSENRFRALVESSSNGIWMVNRDGVTLFANTAMCTMLRCIGGMDGRSLFDFVFPEDLPAAGQRFAQRLGGDRKRRQFRWRRTDGAELYTEVSTSVLFAPNGSIAGVMGFIADISERVEMSDELQRLNLELGQRVEERTRELEESNRDLAREIVVREYVQAELSASNERLNHYLTALQRHTDDISRLNELADQLNACESRRELVQVLQSSCQDLFGTSGGALFEAIGERLDLLEFGWGDCAGLEGAFAPDQCLALDCGKPFPANIEQQQNGVVCAHRPSLMPALCVPLNARGARVGLLLLQRREPFWTGEIVSDRQLEQLLRALAEHTAVALDNLSLRERLREQSLSDPLTGLFNRRYLFEQMQREMAAWERSHRSFALMLIDIDHFKKFNDRYGHAVGDAVLLEVANLLRDYTRRSDLACRLGGEEFVVLMTGAEQAQAISRAEAIREAVKKIRLPGVTEPISISAGVAVYPQHGDDQHGLLRAADQAMYVSKRTGRDRTSMAV